MVSLGGIYFLVEESFALTVIGVCFVVQRGMKCIHEDSSCLEKDDFLASKGTLFVPRLLLAYMPRKDFCSLGTYVRPRVCGSRL